VDNVLAIIPARGGSKGLPNKNIRPLAGHPLISYSIHAALQSSLINRVIVSTDSEDIAKAAKEYGAELPFLRPAQYAQDLSTDFEVFLHALTWLKENEGYVPDFVVQLRPTSPIRIVTEIDICIEKLKNSAADSLRIVTSSPCTPYKMWTIADGSDIMEPLLKLDGVKEPFNQPRQKLPRIYWQVGALDVIRASCITEKKSMSGDTILSHVIPNELSVDIDNLGDFMNAEEVIKATPGAVKFN
jgi:CMP-N,N'-diacetyllegionaminic acid synthase